MPEHSISERTVVAETADLRVVVMVLDQGDIVPWHFHSTITDTFYCMVGSLRVETRAPRAVHILEPGDSVAVPAKRAHEVTNGGDGLCRVVLVQGVGVYDYIPVGG
jgi:quercetin dioxygenase-like cupin family protein